MTKIILPLCLLGGVLAAPLAVAGPEEDRMAMVNYYTERFPAVPMQEFANGLYAFNEDAREQWLELGGVELNLVPSLNSEPLWVEAVTAMIRRHGGE